MPQTLTEELLSLDDDPREVAQFSVQYRGLTPAAGYAAAHAVHAQRVARGWQPVGRKIGFTNRTIWPRYGVFEPMWGTVYDRTLIVAQDGRATVPLAGLVNPRIEPEICFGLNSAPPRTRDPEAIMACIAWIAHSVEIVQCHHAGWKVAIADCTADNGLHGRLVLGTPVPVSDIADLAAKLPRIEVALLRAGAAIDKGVGANVLDSPLNAMAFLIEVLASQPDAPPLRAGEIVSTGTLTDAHPVKPGEIWSTAFTGTPLQGLTVEFA